MYKRIDLERTKKYYKQIVDETLQEAKELKDRFPDITMYAFIYEQIADIKENILTGKLNNPDEIRKRYSLGSLAVKNFEIKSDEYAMKLSDIDGGAIEYNDMSEDITFLIKPIRTKKGYRDLLDKTIKHSLWLIENDVKMLPEVKEKLARMEAITLNREIRNNKNYDLIPVYKRIYNQLTDFRNKVIDNNVELSTYDIRSNYSWDGATVNNFDIETDPYAQNLGELYVKSDEYFNLREE